MPAKRKRDILDGFDPNKSDSEDENFEPGEDRPRRSKKKSRSSRGKSAPARRRRGHYGGSDIEDDEELSDSAQEGSLEEGNDGEEDEDEEGLPTNSAGRRMRKAAAKAQNYKESSEDESVIEDTDRGSDAVEGPSKKMRGRTQPSRIVVLKTNPKNLRSKEPPTPAPTTRRTRAHTEEAEEFVELSNSGKHALPARLSRSKSPEAFAHSTRAVRGSKSIKKPPPPIEEATQESSSHGNAAQSRHSVGGGDGTQDDDEPPSPVEQAPQSS